MRIHCLLMVMLLPGASSAQSVQADPPSEPLTADAIMAQVAVNQDRSEELRKQYVYRQHTHIVSHKPDAETTQTADRTLLEQRQIRGVQGRACARVRQSRW
jgi:hypothetical protein